MASRAIKDETLSEPVEKKEELLKPPSPIQISLDDEMQRIIVDIVKDDYEKSKQDRLKKDYGTTSKGEKLDFDKWYKTVKDLYYGNREAKDTPWRFCSNRSLRIAAAITDLLHARLFPAVWNEDSTRWRPGEITDVPKVERIQKFMDWWIRVHSPLRNFFDQWVKASIGFGDALTETSWDVEEIMTGEMVEEPILDPMGQPVMTPDNFTAMRKFPKPKREEKTKSRIVPKDKWFYMEGACDVQRDVISIEEEFLYKDLEKMENQGMLQNVTTKLKEKIHVSIPEGVTDEVEIERIKKIKLRNVPVKLIRWYGFYDVDGTGFDDSLRLCISPEYNLYLGGVRMRDVTKSGKRPLDVTPYDYFIENPNQLEGEGVLTKVRELAEEIDALFNQMSDSNTLSVLRPGFYDPSGNLDAPVLSLAPNKLTPVDNPSQSVYFPEFKIPVENLINAIRLVMEFIERLTAASSYVMGKESEIVGGSGTATRTNAIMQSADTRFSIPSDRLRDGAARIIGQHLDLIQLNIPAGMETRVLGEDNEPLFQQGELTDEGISGHYDAFLVPDPTFGSKQMERELSSMLYSILLQNVIVGTDPVKIYKVTADLLKAYGKNPEEYLGPEPQSDDIDSPEDENTLMVQGDFGRVRANMAENHLLHIQKHMELQTSPSFQLLMQTAPNLGAQIMQYNQAHIQEHTQMLQAMTALIGGVGGKGGSKGFGAGNPSGDGKTDAKSNGEEPSMGGASAPLGQALDAKTAGTMQTSA